MGQTGGPDPSTSSGTPPRVLTPTRGGGFRPVLPWFNQTGQSGSWRVRVSLGGPETFERDGGLAVPLLRRGTFVGVIGEEGARQRTRGWAVPPAEEGGKGGVSGRGGEGVEESQGDSLVGRSRVWRRGRVSTRPTTGDPLGLGAPLVVPVPLPTLRRPSTVLSLKPMGRSDPRGGSLDWGREVGRDDCVPD